MSDIVIKIENLSKIYRLGEIGTGTLSHDLNRWFKMNVLQQDDPYAKIGHVNDRTKKAEKGELVAALRDINVEVKRGEVLGIIGKNGAGKSTLLKLLSRVTSPTTGTIKTKGRLASLLEVGTGFHPEMTGRENIYMNGTIMGMRRWEITKKLEEIVDFAGVAKYLDTPTKRYSSGMTVRLGFAIAAFLEPEILIVDEVLAVGDAEFQKKAIGKMQDVSKGQGRTVLFVSHNMAAVKTLCESGIVLVNGQKIFSDTAENAVRFYLKEHSETISIMKSWDLADAPGNENIKLLFAEVKPASGETFEMDSGITFSFKYYCGIENQNIGNTIFISTEDDLPIMELGGQIHENSESKKGILTNVFYLPANILNAGRYKVHFQTGYNQAYLLYRHENLLTFEVNNKNRGFNSGKAYGVVRPSFKMESNLTEVSLDD